jgi:hypothetical protein
MEPDPTAGIRSPAACGPPDLVLGNETLRLLGNPAFDGRGGGNAIRVYLVAAREMKVRKDHPSLVPLLPKYCRMAGIDHPMKLHRAVNVLVAGGLVERGGERFDHQRNAPVVDLHIQVAPPMKSIVIRPNALAWIGQEVLLDQSAALRLALLVQCRDYIREQVGHLCVQLAANDLCLVGLRSRQIIHRALRMLSEARMIEVLETNSGQRRIRTLPRFYALA